MCRSVRVLRCIIRVVQDQRGFHSGGMGQLSSGRARQNVCGTAATRVSRSAPDKLRPTPFESCREVAKSQDQTRAAKNCGSCCCVLLLSTHLFAPTAMARSRPRSMRFQHHIASSMPAETVNRTAGSHSVEALCPDVPCRSPAGAGERCTRCKRTRCAACLPGNSAVLYCAVLRCRAVRPGRANPCEVF